MVNVQHKCYAFYSIMALYKYPFFCSLQIYLLSIEHLLLCRAEFTKYIVTPALGVSGVGGAMAVYGAFDAMVSIRMQNCQLASIFNYSMCVICAGDSFFVSFIIFF